MAKTTVARKMKRGRTGPSGTRFTQGLRYYERKKEIEAAAEPKRKVKRKLKRSSPRR